MAPSADPTMTASRYRAELDEVTGLPHSPKKLILKSLDSTASSNEDAPPPRTESPAEPEKKPELVPQRPPGNPNPKAPAVRSAMKGTRSSMAVQSPGCAVPPPIVAEATDAGEVGKARSTKFGEAESLAIETKSREPKSRTQMRARGSIWTDPTGHSARSVLTRLYKYAEQALLWEQMEEDEKVNHTAENESAVLQVELDNEDTPEDDLQELPEEPKGAASKDGSDVKKTDLLRRPSRVAINNTDRSKLVAQANAAREKAATTTAAGAEVDGAAAVEGPNPLKEVLTAKKVDVDKVRSVLESLGDSGAKWINAPLDNTSTPAIPCALFHVVALGREELVSLVLEFKADVTQVYEGKMYLGSVKSGQTALQCVQSRKGRFVGTMLGKRLEQIEALLQGAEGGGAEKPSDVSAGGEAMATDRVGSKTLSEFRGEFKKDQRKLTTGEPASAPSNSVPVDTPHGQMLHTQGHPVKKYDIDAGQHGTCLTARMRDATGQVVIKIKSKADNSNGAETSIWEEVNFLRRLKHGNVIRLHETFEDKSHIFLILEFCGAGALFDVLVQQAGKISEAQSKNMARQLAAGVEYLHEELVCHRDIQPCNVLLVDSDLDTVCVKLIDFSTAKDFEKGVASMRTKVCTPSYVAPEILSQDENFYTEKVDIWSLGVVTFIMLVGFPPFRGKTDVEILKKVRKANLKFQPEERWAAISDDAKDLLKKMMTKSPEERLSAIECRAHPWFS
eukprot:TRINITY_DN11961_c0_g2_i1.p1 TRINITY_DN11961_c0_g2~~TRINITY_DN11961_c0_g2_i1.p1  ORF type:complete len:733 (+),score=203.22 TRINITY_DN11961_c0_g2_i1:132-2330(+)